MKNWIFAICLLVAIGELSAQKHDRNWVFGYGYFDEQPDHRTGIITVREDSVAITLTNWDAAFFETCVSMSDPNGRLLFFSNGCHVYNAAGEIMLHGDTLNEATDYWISFCTSLIPGQKIFHGAFALPDPGDTARYYLLHSQAFAFSQPFVGIWNQLYSLIDMRGDGGMGEVIAKNVPLTAGNRSLERASAVRHGNGRDWWVITPDNLGPYYYRWLITPEGIQGPFTQYDPDKLVDSFGANQSIRFTPNGKKMIWYHNRLGIVIQDFDRCTGLLGEGVFIPHPPGSPGGWHGLDCEVSPNGRYMYAPIYNFSRLIQYDLEADDIAMSGDTVAVWDGTTTEWGPTVFAYLERWPDNKIYVNAGQTIYMHVINQPDLPGLQCEVIQRGLTLGARSRLSLPHFPNYRLYDDPESPCDTLGIDDPTLSVSGPADRGGGDLVVFPNPATEAATLLWEGPTTGYFTIHDAIGREYHRQPLTRDRHSFRTAHWPPGVYVVRVWQDGKLWSGKLIVRH